MSAQPPARAYLMAAGLGTRLYPLTGLTSKPMVPILNRPVMEHLLRLLRRHDVTEIAANLHYHPEKIRSYFGDGAEFGVDLRYNLEEHLLGTAGGADAFREFLCGSTFLVMSGDGLTDIDLSAFLSAHRASGGIATMAVKEVDDPSLYGVVVHDDQMRVVGFQEKPPREEALSTLCNCGIYAFEPQIFDYIEPGTFVDWARDVFPALLEDGLPFHCWELETYWNDVGNIEQYRLSNFDALLGRVALDVPGRQIAPRVWVGQGTETRGRRPSGAADPPGRGLPHRVRRRAHRPAHHRRRVRRRARSGARGSHPVGRREGGPGLTPGRQHPGTQRGRASRGRGARGCGDRRPFRGRAAHAHRGRRAARAAHVRRPSMGTTPAVAGSDDAAGSARGGRTRRLTRSRLPAALRRLPCSRFLALRRLRRRTQPAARRPLPALRRAARARRPAGAHRLRREAHAGLS